MFDEIFINFSPEHLGELMQPGLCHYLIFGLIIFITGIILVVTGKNLIKILIGIEFMLNSVCINFAAANTYMTSENAVVNAETLLQDTISNSFAPVQNLYQTFLNPEGQAASLIIIAIGAINTAVVLTMIYAIFFRFKNINTSFLDKLKSADCPTDKDLENEGGL